MIRGTCVLGADVRSMGYWVLVKAGLARPATHDSRDACRSDEAAAESQPLFVFATPPSGTDASLLRTIPPRPEFSADSDIAASWQPPCSAVGRRNHALWTPISFVARLFTTCWPSP